MTLLIVQLLTTAFMAGLIWTIQLLHYPAFAFVREDGFAKFHQQHTRNITFIVAPVMFLEIIAAFLLVRSYPTSPLLWSNCVLLLLTWGFTFFLSVPLHTRLSGSYNLKVIHRLVATNWLRTTLWTIRVPLLFYVCLRIFAEQNNVNFVK